MTHRKLTRLRFIAACIFVLLITPTADAVVPVLVGPFQAFLALLPTILAALGGLLVALFKPSTVKKLILFLWHQKIFSLCLILLIGGVVYGESVNWGVKPKVTDEQTGDNWPAFRGGRFRRGYAPGDKDPVTPDPIWNYVRENTFYSSPTVVGNRIYATFADYGYFKDRGAILCIDADTGGEVWRYDGEGFRATFSSPAVQGERIVCGEGLHLTKDARIVCIDKSGKRVWSHRTKSHVESSPCIYKGHVYIGAGDDGYYCIALKPKANGEPDIKWHLLGDNYLDCESSPIVYKDVLYFGLGLGGKAIVAVEADPNGKGKELWRIETPYPVFGAPAVREGRLYIGMGNGDFVNSAEQVRANLIAKMEQQGRSKKEIEEATKSIVPAGEVWCIDLETKDPEQRIKWKKKLGRTILGAVAIGDERLYVGSRDRHLYCLDFDGNIKSKKKLPGEVKTSPAIGLEHVYVVTESPVTGAGFLHCLVTADDELEAIWEVRLGGGGNFFSSPAIARGHVYVGTSMNGLRCIGTDEPPPPLWAHGERGGRVDLAPFPEKGRFVWRYPKTNTETKLDVTAPLLSVGDGICVPAKRNGKPEFFKLSLEYKRNMPDEKRVIWTVPFKLAISVPPAGVGNTVRDETIVQTGSLFVVDGKKGDEGRMLHSINSHTGKPQWEVPIHSGASGRVTLDRRRVYVWSGPETLTCYPVADKKPAPLWSADLGPGGLTPQPVQGMVFAVTDTELVALDAATGVALWPAPVKLAATPALAPIRAGEAIVVCTPDKVTAYGITDGAVQWTSSIAPNQAGIPPVENAGRLAIVTRKGEVAAIDVERVEQLIALRSLLEPAGPEAGTPPILLGPVTESQKALKAAGAFLTSLGLKDPTAAQVMTGFNAMERMLQDAPSLLDLTGKVLDDVGPARLVPGVGQPIPPVVASGRIAFATKDRLSALRSLRAAPTQWLNSRWLGTIITPLLTFDSNTYFATDKKGVICVGPSNQ